MSIVDGSNDIQDSHYVSIIMQFVDQNNVLRVEFYKLIPLHISSTGRAYFDKIKEDLEHEGLWEHVKENVSGLITDAGKIVWNTYMMTESLYA